MREHHCVHEAEAPGEWHGCEIGDRGAQAGHEENRTGRSDGQAKPLEEPKRKQRVDNEAAAERVDREQGREAIDAPPGRAERGWRALARGFRMWREIAEKQGACDPERPVEQKE